MTSPDDDLSWLLRRELNAEAARLSPAQDGLSQIRAQLGSRPAVPVWGPLWGGLRVDAERYGLRARHLAAEAAEWVAGLFPARRDRGAEEQAAGTAGARRGLVWLRPVLAAAAVCIFAGTAAAVPGLRHAITNIGSSGSGSTTSVTGTGGGSGLGTGHRSGGGNGPAGAHHGTSATATPAPTATCTTLAEPVPSAKATPGKSSQPGRSAASPAASPAQSSPAATPTTEPASPTESPTTPTGSSGPTPTGTSGGPSGGGGGATESTHLTRLKPCPGPALKGSASAAAAAASVLPTAIPAPAKTSARVEEPAVTPATTASSTPATPATPAAPAAPAAPATSSDPSPSVTASGTGSSGSPWSQGFSSAHACWRHPHHSGCPGS